MGLTHWLCLWSQQISSLSLSFLPSCLLIFVYDKHILSFGSDSVTVSMNYRGPESSSASSLGDLRAPLEGEAGLSPGVHVAKGRSSRFAESVQRGIFFFKDGSRCCLVI